MRLGAFGRKTLYMSGARGSALDQARGRLVLVSAVFVIAYIIVAARLVDVSLIQGELQQNRQDEISYVQPESEAHQRRADITDRNGILLARSLTTASLYADPALILDADGTAKALVQKVSGLTYGDVLKKLQSDSRFVWIKRNLTPDEQQQVLYLGDPGLAFQYEDRRVYPQGELAAHMVGYSGVDGQGLAGVEASFDKLLREGDKPLELTLDVRLQHILRREIADSVDNFSAKGGAGIIMDIHSGEVLAAVSYPDFDPHHLPAADDKRLFNRVTLGVYEPGSTFKIFSTAAALELKHLPLSHQFDATEPLQAGRFKINDYHAENRFMSIPEVFMHSSNIGSALMGQMVGTDSLKKFYADLGLMDASKVEIAEVSAPLVPSPWREVNTLTAAFGHGIAVSPLQLVSGAATILNGGIQVKPTLIHQVKAGKEKEVRVVSEQTAHRMRQLLRLVVSDGTGGKADVPGYEVGGKTGTAEKTKPGGGYDKNRLVSSFIGAFPMSAPQYIVYIMIDEPHGTQATYGYATGGWVAAPYVGKAIESMAAVLGIEPGREDDRLVLPLRRYVKTKEEITAERRATNASFTAH